MATNGNNLAGTAAITSNGRNFRLAASAKYSVNTVKRETLTGMDGVHGFKETPVPGWISATLRDAGDLTVADFEAMVDETVVLELANGKTVTGNGVWTVDAQEVDAAEGTFDVKWEGPSVTED
jgi:hypothetical protein